MRTQINLATQPYENAGRFWTFWGVVLLVVIAGTGGLVYAAGRSWRSSHVSERLLVEQKNHLAKLNDEEKKDVELLSKPENNDVRVRSEFFNALILRKQFSWTRIFSDLEKIMPDHLHVVSITPALDEDNQIVVNMQVAGESRERAIELIANMEKSATFRDARVDVETAVQQNEAGRPATDKVQFQITAIYQPNSHPREEAGQ